MRLAVRKIPTRHTLRLRIPAAQEPVLYPILPEGRQEPHSAPIATLDSPNPAEAVEPRKAPLNAPQRLLPVDYEPEAVALLDYFVDALPQEPVRLAPHVLIVEPALFVEGHLETLLRHPRNPVFQPYLDRLRSLRGICTSGCADVGPKMSDPEPFF
jgi:hypothetical protein